MRAALALLLALFVGTAHAQVTPGTSPLSTAKGGTGIVPDAKCNGTTDDTAAFSRALAASAYVSAPPATVCVVKNLVVTAGRMLDCGGAGLKAAPGADWIVKKTGFMSVVRNCRFDDPSSFTKISTTLNGTAAPGATTIVVTSAARMAVNQAIAVLLDSGAYHLTKITAISGTTITLADAIPASQVGVPTVSAGGTGYAVGDQLAVQSGVGAPITLSVATVSSDAVATVTLNAPGLYSTFPTSPAATLNTKAALASGATVTLTSAGASSGAIVEAAWGVLVSDNATQGLIDNVVFSSVPGALQLLNSAGSGSGTGETVRSIMINAFQLFGLFKDVHVHDARFESILGFGATHNASAYGVVGVYINGNNPGAPPTGGNLFRGVNMLNAETGWLSNSGQLDTFTQTISDTLRNYGWVCNGCTSNTWGGGAEATFTGPAAVSGSGGKGGGMYFGRSAINNIMEGLRTSSNAYDLHIDATSALWLNNQAWGTFKVLSGVGTAVTSGTLIFSANSPSGVGGAGTTIFLGASGYSTSEGAVAGVNSLKGSVSKFMCASGQAPGAGQSFTCNLRIKSVTRASCSYSGASAFGCNYQGPGIFIFDQDTIDMSIVSSAGAVATSFRAYVVGL